MSQVIHPLGKPAEARGTVEGARCEDCPFAREGQPDRPVTGEGARDPLWVIIDEGPGGDETRIGRPLIGESGHMINRALQAAKADRAKLWITQATLCQAPPGASDNQKHAARRCCAPRLLSELEKMPGRPLLVLGGVAAAGFLGKRLKISEIAGSYFKVQVGTPEMREVADQADALEQGREKVAARAEKLGKALAAAEVLHEATCQERGLEEGAHLKRCKAWKKVQRTRADQYAAARELASFEVRIAQARQAFDVMATARQEPLRPIIASIRPAAILRGGAGVGGAHSPDLAYWNLVYDVAKVHGLASGTDLVFREDDYETEWRDPDRADQLVDKILAMIAEKRWVAVDCETYVEDPQRHSALEPLWAKLRALGLAVPGWAISVYWAILRSETQEKIRAMLADPGIEKVCHNKLYDDPVLKANGFPMVGSKQDTMLLHHSAFPGMSHKLQHVGSQFYAVSPWKSEFRAADDTPQALTAYNAKDTLVTARIRRPLEIIVRRNAAEAGYAMDMQLADIAQHMHEVGVPVSRAVNKELGDQFSINIRKAREGVEEKANSPGIREQLWLRLAFEQAQRKRKADPDTFSERLEKRAGEIRKDFERGKWRWSISNPEHAIAYLKARNVPLLQKTKSGRTSTSKTVLESLVHVPEVADILQFRENEKLLSTFCRPMFVDGKKRAAYADANDRIHPTWSVHAITTRWRAWNPMAQNWPKADPKKGRPNLRDQVRAPPGRTFVGFDFAQLEARVIALMSGDPFLVKLFNEDRDIHSEFARIVWRDFDQQDSKTRKVLRDMIKRPEYGSFFGGSIETLWKNVVKDYPKVQIADIARMVKTMQDAMPGVERWHNDLIKLAAQPPFEVTSAIVKRRRCFPLGNAEITDLYNWPVQTTGAIIMNTGLIRIYPLLMKRFHQAFPILHIHDAAVIECWKNDAPKIAELVTECFSQEHTVNGVTVKFPVTPDIDDSWANV